MSLFSNVFPKRYRDTFSSATRFRECASVFLVVDETFSLGDRSRNSASTFREGFDNGLRDFRKIDVHKTTAGPSTRLNRETSLVSNQSNHAAAVPMIGEQRNTILLMWWTDLKQV